MRKIYSPETNKIVTERSNPNETTRHYITSADGDVPRFEPFISDVSYAEALSGAVIKCVDVVIIDPDAGAVLVATRDQEPQAGKWVFGGRKRAGETSTETAVINMRREFGFEIDPDNLIDTGHEYDMVWDTRAQAATADRHDDPVTSCHMTATVYTLPLRKDSLDTSTHNEEFSHLEWIPVDDILNSDPGEYHPTLVDYVRDSLDALTTPNAPTTIDEAVERADNQLSYLKARQRERAATYARIGSALSAVIDKQS